MNSTDIKILLMEYYRFEKQHICSSETPMFVGISDIIAYDFKESLIDVEIKISKADLLKDCQKLKHKYYNEGIPSRRKKLNIPNKFYFCVPKELESIAVKEAERINSKYGVIVIEGKNLTFVKRAYKLHDIPVNKEKVLNQIMMRNNTEVICLKKKLRDLSK